jgi:hypothetical protein
MIPTSIQYSRLRRVLMARQVRLDPDAGASTVEVLSWAAMSVVAIVAIGAALQVLGLDVITYVRGQLGV